MKCTTIFCPKEQKIRFPTTSVLKAQGLVIKEETFIEVSKASLSFTINSDMSRLQQILKQDMLIGYEYPTDSYSLLQAILILDTEIFSNVGKNRAYLNYALIFIPDKAVSDSQSFYKKQLWEHQGCCPECGESGRLDPCGGASCSKHGFYQLKLVPMPTEPPPEKIIDSYPFEKDFPKEVFDPKDLSVPEYLKKMEILLFGEQPA